MKITPLQLVFMALCLAASVMGVDQWWEYGNFYQIYPRSFQDSNGDGVGDLNGITMRLDYIKYLGVTGIWLSPIFQSPMKDFGYDISDYRAIHHEYGTMEDFERLAKKCKQLGIKLILDFVPNHTSDEHEWFKQSKAGNAKYRDYYVWANGKSDGKPPSNWQSIFSGNAWTLDSTTNQYYLHQFLASQPDLNYRNEDVQKEIKDVIQFWLNKGVDGFRIDAIAFVYENVVNGVFPDEEEVQNCTEISTYYCLKHTETFDRSESFDLIYEWRRFIDEEYTDSPRILMSEAYGTLENTLKYYGSKDANNQVTTYGAQIPFNFELLMYTNYMSKPSDIKQHIYGWLNGMPKGEKVHANWVLGNHDNRRIASRYGPTRTDLLNILLKTLPGIAVTYNGEEIGMTDVEISWKDTVDPQACRAGEENYQRVSRDPERTPFQWEDSKNAGFSTAAKTWLPVGPNYMENNAKLQALQLNSHLNMFRRLLLLRENPAMKYGELVMEIINDDKVLGYTREIKNNSAKENDIVVVLLNIVNYNQSVSLKNAFGNLPTKLEVVVVSIQATNYFIGDAIDAEQNVELEGDVGIVLIGRK